MQRRTAKRMTDALNAARKAVSFVGDHSFEEFLADELLRAGVERQLLTIGEALNAARREDQTIERRVPAIHEWVGLRNRIIHMYDDVDYDLIWNVVLTEVHELIDDLENAMRDAPPTGAASDEGEINE
jgi:uncharacterized protein with HEPN domain